MLSLLATAFLSLILIAFIVIALGLVATLSISIGQSLRKQLRQHRD